MPSLYIWGLFMGLWFDSMPLMLQTKNHGPIINKT
jgi:hypothetical protein